MSASTDSTSLAIQRLENEVRAILRLSGPLMAAQGGLMLMGVVDTIIVGRMGALEMSAVALGNSITGAVQVFGFAAPLGAEPLIAQAHGARDPRSAWGWLCQALYLAFALSLPLTLITWIALMWLESFGVPHDIAERTRAFAFVRLIANPAILGSICFRSYLSCTNRPRPILTAVIACNVINAVLDVLLVYGKLGFPAMGAVGSAWATTLVNHLLLLAWGFAAFRTASEDAGERLSLRARAELSRIREVFKLGWPAGCHVALEVGVFSAVSALIARFGSAQLAGHQIAITLASLTFMSALGISNATTARVGNHIGAGRSPEARRAGFLGIGLGATFMATGGLAFILIPEALARLFTTDEEVIRAAVTLLRIAGAFAISDGIQVVSAGALRGAGDTKWTFYANLVAHWVVGLPLGLWLGHAQGLGAAGYWWGLTVGLTGVALTLLGRFAVLSSRPLARVEASATRPAVEHP
jgi:MATE family multidrug resistance protein